MIEFLEIFESRQVLHIGDRFKNTVFKTFTRIFLSFFNHPNVQAYEHQSLPFRIYI